MSENNTEKKVAKFARSYNIAEGTFTGVYADGESITLNVNDLPESIRMQCMLHGLQAKIGDTVADKTIVGDILKASVNAVINQLKNGTFNRSGGGGNGGGDIVKAIAFLKERTEEEAAAFWTAADDDTKAAIRKHPHVKAFIAKAKADRAMEAAAGTADF